MQVNARLKHLRIAPRKVRLVADIIRNKKAEEAQMILNFTVKKAAKPMLDLVNSAVANAQNNLRLDPKNLYISKIAVDEGPKLKRWMPRARGRAGEIQKKTSHITLVLEEIKSKAKKAKENKEKPEVIKRPGTDVKDAIKESPEEAKKKEFKKRDKDLRRPKKTSGAGPRIFRRKSI
jgi:large subunit ribosomal protein L22